MHDAEMPDWSCFLFVICVVHVGLCRSISPHEACMSEVRKKGEGKHESDLPPKDEKNVGEK